VPWGFPEASSLVSWASKLHTLHPSKKYVGLFLDLFGAHKVSQTTKYKKRDFCILELNTNAKRF
jgi:hypothetical protein